ncbi:MAG: LysR family transcriptional regulator [Pseudoxanthomonas sp.]
MRYHKLDLNLLSALKVLLEKRNVTRAGEALHVTQSAMSGILARLRDYFDDPLIVQVGRRMELTPLAESLIDPVNDVLLRIDATIATRPDFDPQVMKRHFTFVASDYVSAVFLCDVLRRVHREAPGITWKFRQPSEFSAQELESGDVDFIISPEQFASPTQSMERLFEDSYVVAVAEENPHVGDTITLEQYLGSGHVSFQTGTQGLPMFESWATRNYGEAARRVEVTANSFHLLPQLIIGTDRIATLHARMAACCLGGLPIRLVRPLFEMPQLVEVLQWHRYRDLDRGSQWLRQRIVEMAHAMPEVASLLDGSLQAACADYDGSTVVPIKRKRAISTPRSLQDAQ